MVLNHLLLYVDKKYLENLNVYMAVVFATNCFKKYGFSIEWDFDGVKKGM